MAEPRSPNSSSPERRVVQVSPCSSSIETAAPGTSDLQPITLGPTALSSSFSSTMIPVRLDVLYFLLTSAFKGAHHAFPLMSAHAGQGSLSACRGPAPQPGATSLQPATTSCCSCYSACHGLVSYPTIQQSAGIQQYGRSQGGYGGQGWPSPGVLESQNNGPHWGGPPSQQSDGFCWSDGSQSSSAGRWRGAQSPVDWQDNQRKGGGGRGGGRGRGGYGNRDNWQGRRQNFQKSWDNHRQGEADSFPWKSASRDSGRGAPSFGSNSGNGKRSQEGPPWQALRGGPDAKRRSEGAGTGWQPAQQAKPSPTSVGNTAGAGPAQTGGKDNDEDWEAEYESNGQAAPSASGTLPLSSLQNDQAGPSKAGKDLDEGSTPLAVPSKSSLATFLLPELATKEDQVAAAVGKEPLASPGDHSKNDGFASYLQNLYSNPPRKTSSDGSSDLVIDTDVESLKPEEED